MDDFVDPEPVRLPLSGGQFIDVKRWLNHGESDEMWARMSPYVVPGEPLKLDRREVRTAKVLAYLLGWSLTRKGVPVPMSPEMSDADRAAAVNALHPDRFIEIFLAVDAHEDAEQAARDAQKKIRDTPPAAVPTSVSPSAADGALNGSGS